MYTERKEDWKKRNKKIEIVRNAMSSKIWFYAYRMGFDVTKHIRLVPPLQGKEVGLLKIKNCYNRLGTLFWTTVESRMEI